MATIRKRGGRYNVQIRKLGYRSITKTFTHIAVARKWAAGVETDMERRLHVEVADDTILKTLLSRYEAEILPTHKSHQVERYRLKTLNRHLGHLRLIDLSAKHVAT